MRGRASKEQTTLRSGPTWNTTIRIQPQPMDPNWVGIYVHPPVLRYGRYLICHRHLVSC